MARAAKNEILWVTTVEWAYRTRRHSQNKPSKGRPNREEFECIEGSKHAEESTCSSIDLDCKSAWNYTLHDGG